MIKFIKLSECDGVEILINIDNPNNPHPVPKSITFFNNSVAYNFVTTFLPVKIDDYMVRRRSRDYFHCQLSIINCQFFTRL